MFLPKVSRRAQGSAVALLLATCLTGCARPDIAAPESGLPVPPQWVETQQDVRALDVSAYWLRLNDPVLMQLVEQASANNLDIAQATARLKQAQAQLKGSRSAYFPQISGSGSGRRNFNDSLPDQSSYSLGIDAGWEIDLFGRIGADVSASEAELAAAGYSLGDMQRLITGQVALATISARATALQLAIARDSLQSQDDNLQIARWRVQAGLVSSLDVEQARSQRASTAASIPQLESNLAATANAISTLIGEPPGRVLLLLQESDFVPTPPEIEGFEAPADVIRRRPDVRQAEARLIASTARIEGARAQLFPLIQLGGSIGTSSFGIDSLFDIITGGLFGSVSQLIFDGGRTRAQIDSTRAAAEGSLAAWRLSILGALEDVETSAVDLEKSQERVAIFGEAVDAANNSAILARSQYQAGLTDFQNLLTSELQLRAARNSEVAAQAERASAFVRLTQALGGGWSPTEYPLPVSDRTGQ